MVVIFPFEEKIYRDAGVPVNFVGHPLVDVVRPTMTREEFAARHGLDAAQPIVTLMPGSRRGEHRAAFFALLVEARVNGCGQEQQGGRRDTVCTCRSRPWAERRTLCTVHAAVD